MVQLGLEASMLTIVQWCSIFFHSLYFPSFKHGYFNFIKSSHLFCCCFLLRDSFGIRTFDSFIKKQISSFTGFVTECNFCTIYHYWNKLYFNFIKASHLFCRLKKELPWAWHHSDSTIVDWLIDWTASRSGQVHVKRISLTPRQSDNHV